MEPKEKAEKIISEISKVLEGWKLTDLKVKSKKIAFIRVNSLIETLPNINETPPIYRKSEEHYSQYWRAVKLHLERL